MLEANSNGLLSNMEDKHFVEQDERKPGVKECSYKTLYSNGVSQNSGYLLLVGVPMIRTIVYWGQYWGPPIEGNQPACSTQS